MERVLVRDLMELQDKEVRLFGWIHNIKAFKEFSFAYLRDRSGIVQMIIDDEKILSSLKLESSVKATGRVQMNEKAPGGVEIIVSELEVVGEAKYDLLPFTINGIDINASLDKQLDYRTISLRRMDRRAVFKVQQEIVQAYRDFLTKEGFTEIHTPKIIGMETEGGADIFMLDYFGTRAFMAQSPQFYKQMMVGAGFERVFEIGAAYRAEPHSTWRHLNEYMSLDLEMGFIESEEEIMDLEERLIKHMISHLKTSCVEELKIMKAELPTIETIPRITLSDAQSILLEKFGKKSPVGNIDAEGEKIFAQYVKDEYHSDFVFLTKYPASKRPLYTMPDDSLEGMTKSFDLIFKGLEITTGGQRIHDYDMLVKSILKSGGKTEDFDFYLESFKYGVPPHGGLAIGLERITMMFLGLDNIRKATLLPRDINRVKP
ncbi:MAG: Aspartyl-tRNA synthetase [Clostridiales bacterium 38_11]|nr:MAG: Aspartyl-tRNA synthetase [Clostridiales bacterium 38_11]HBH13767.1 aspartate--tRNA(Asn) ligase [Clostridiales bacterium]